MSYPESSTSILNNPSLMRRAFELNLFLFIIFSIIDPADLFFGIKVQLFILLFFTFLGTYWRKAVDSRFLIPVICYTAAFIVIPLASVWFAQISKPGQPNDAFILLKSFFLIVLFPMLYISNTNAFKLLSYSLISVSFLIFFLFILKHFFGISENTLNEFGNKYGLFYMDERDYGGIIISQFYYATSQMLIVSFAYFFHKYQLETKLLLRIFFAAFMLIIFLSLLLSGSRNNIFGSFFLLFLLFNFLVFRKHSAVAILVLTIAVLLSIGLAGAILSQAGLDQGLVFPEVTAFLSGPETRNPIIALLDPAEVSNAIKIGYLADYMRIFSDPRTLVFGQGLGTYQYWESRDTTNFVTELTYLEMVRYFGVFGAIAMMTLLIYPIWRAFFRCRDTGVRAFAISYGVYLLLCVSNPNLFSSMGITILSILLANTFIVPASDMTPAQKKI